MGSIKNEAGNTYGRLTVICEHGRDNWNQVTWLCECECGSKVVKVGVNLRNGDTKSCGCLFKDATTTHGMSKSPTYTSWQKMKSRCTSESNDHYERYGGRGIKVCSEWLNSFENFYKDMGERPNGMTLDRTDNNGDYVVTNCKWSTPKEQMNNTSCNHYLRYKDEVLSIAEWSRKLNIKQTTIHDRIRRGWSVEETLTIIT